MGDYMAIVGFNFTKINVERKGALTGKIDIKNNVAITGVEESTLSLGASSQKVAKILFDYTVAYEPKMGSMKFSGEVLYLAEAAKVEEFAKNWKKSKSLPKEVAPVLINTILNKCNVQALILSQQINLPPPIPLPKVKTEAPAAKK